MAVRIKVEIKSLEKTPSAVTTVALLNSGFECEKPEVLVPIKIAELLSFYPHIPKETHVQKYETPAGMIKMHSIEDSVQVCPIVKGKKTKSVKCTLIISEIEKEVIISDVAVDKLRIKIDEVGACKWHLKGEKISRPSERPQYW